MTALRSCVLIAALLTACGHEPPAVKTGSASVTVELVPVDAKCIQISAIGNTKSQGRSIDVVPEQSAVFVLTDLLPGPTAFSAVAYDVDCEHLGGSTPAWASDEVVATVSLSTPVGVTLTMHPVVTTGGAVVTIDFPPVVGPGVITEFSLPATGVNYQPFDIVTGPDGHLWFIDRDHLGRMTVEGSVIEDPLPAPFEGQLEALTATPDGNVWLGWVGGFGKAAPGMHIIFDPTEMKLPLPTTEVNGMAVGQDGNIWFLEYYGGNGGVVGLSGAINEIPLGVDYPGQGIAAGSSGDMFFAANYDVAKLKGPQLGLIQVATGNVILLPSTAAANELWSDVIAGPDGAIWFVRGICNSGNDPYQCSSMTFALSSYSGAGMAGYTLSALSRPARICAGPDGNIWFTDLGTNSIGRLEPESGTITLFPVPTALAAVNGITAGPDGNVWFTEYLAGKIGRITTR